MATYRTTIVVPVAPAAAFDYLADVTNTKAWDPSIVEAERVDDGPVRVGSRFRLVVGVFGRRIELTYEIEQLESPSRLVFAAANKSVASRDTITVDRAPEGARVTYEADLRLKGALRLLDRGLQLQFTTMSDRAAAGLKEKLGALV
jgi:carbon monoxide dehydrogenase subunit G